MDVIIVTYLPHFISVHKNDAIKVHSVQGEHVKSGKVIIIIHLKSVHNYDDLKIRM